MIKRKVFDQCFPVHSVLDSRWGGLNVTKSGWTKEEEEDRNSDAKYWILCNHNSQIHQKKSPEACVDPVNKM